MNYLITGGAGFIGSHLSERLVVTGHKVWIFDNLTTGAIRNIRSIKTHPHLTFIQEDIRTSRTLPSVVDRVDAIFHLAASVGVENIVNHTLESTLNNLQGDERMLRLAAQASKPILIASSSEVYGKRKNEDLNEDDDLVLGPTAIGRWSYAATKITGEHLALAYFASRGLPVVVVRLFNIIGERQSHRYGMVVPRFVRQALAGKPLTAYGTGKQTRSFCYVRDILPVLITLVSMTKAYGQVFNVGSRESITINDLAKRIIKRTGSTSKIIHIPYAQVFGDNFQEAQYRRPSLAKLNSIVRYRPEYGLDDAIDKISAHLSGNRTTP